MRPVCAPEQFSDLEIGPETGQATLPLARLGCSIAAIELGAEMAAVARSNLRSFPKLEVVVFTIEDWPLPEQKFDLVVSANAFQWIDENVRMSKAADALREGGALAVISTHYIRGGTQAFFDAVQPLYEKHELAPHLRLSLPLAQAIPKDGSEFAHEKRFGKWNFEDMNGRESTRLGNILICCRHTRITTFYHQTQREGSWEKFLT